MSISYEHQLLMRIALGKFDEWNKDKKYVSVISCPTVGYAFENKDRKKRVVIQYKPDLEIPDCAGAVPDPYISCPDGVYLKVIETENYEKIGIFYIEDKSSIKLIPHYLDRWAR